MTNVVASSAARDADGAVYLHAGPEIGVASTKTFVAHLVRQKSEQLTVDVRTPTSSGVEVTNKLATCGNEAVACQVSVTAPRASSTGSPPT
jgi:glucosamine 6-phosphate synthetase-like amidotransferase/phosphosugar isomerase protein